MKIEWASSFRSDGSRCRPPPSTMHGWLAKMRGTLLGNEELRSKGMKEMREARDARKRRTGRNGQPHRASTGRSMFSILSFYMGPSKQPVRQPANTRNISSRPTYRSHQSHRSHTKNVRPSLNSSGTLRRSTGGRTHREPASRSYNGTRNNRRSTR
ncbi:hypothetical protein BYT27DRAFT_7182698 [Phlegmacium glaucopus]|nr:hypothetical protein BYT27DRAFT_7182698 [Phlegmacium glaucopus]